MLRVGIIGTGAISDAHIRAFLQFPEQCEIVALVDIVREKAEAKREAHGLRAAQVLSDSAELLHAGLDLVSIATPPATHAELTIAFLRAGVHVIVEKPMAPSMEECDAMLAAQAESGKLLSVIAQNRFRDDLATLKEVVDSDLLGRISHVQVDSTWWRGSVYYDLWWRGTWAQEGGGCTLNHAIHHIDLALWLMGRPPKAVSALMVNAQHSNAEVEDLSVAIWEYDRALLELTSSVVHHGEEQGIVVQAEHARVSQPWKVVADVSQANGFAIPGGNSDLVEAIESLAKSHRALTHIGHNGQIGDVLSAIRNDRSPAITGEDGRNAIELVTAIYQSAIERCAVDLPLKRANPYYRQGTLIEKAPRFFEKTITVDALEGQITLGGAPDAR